MLLLSSAFAAVSISIFFFSVLYVSDLASQEVTGKSRTTKATILLVAVDVAAVYSIVINQTSNSRAVLDPLLTMIAAGTANGIYALMAADVI